MPSNKHKHLKYNSWGNHHDMFDVLILAR